MNMRNVAVSIVLLTLVTFAGCVSEPVNDAPDANATKSTTTMALDDLSFPDGTSDERIENASVLAETHSEILADRSYTAEFESVATNEDGRIVTTQTVRHETDSDGKTEEWYADREVSSADRESHTASYANKSSVYTKRVNDTASYDVRRMENGVETPNGIISSLTPILTAGEYRNSHVVSRDGERLVEYRFAGLCDDATASDLETVTNVSGSVLVSQQGVVHRASVNLTNKQGGSESNSQLDY
ncbi:hypothetical protein ACFFQF_03330 [Haladaptatus pallidirubidus]|uniref:Uncharacterized protein n=1 Tax=Haladaptatus pallidirubidus TaxID=1008152 RepID=A0AAV3UKD2_9EURY|nr:hypothetical protein [Haladaptatus pallidirubidus]